MKTFEEWCNDREIFINELSPKFLTMAYKIWGEECFVEGQRYEAENAALRERLEKAVELPFHPDDYHIELDFARLVVSTRIQGCKIAIPIYAYINCEDENSAEARLAELKGGENERF